MLLENHQVETSPVEPTCSLSDALTVDFTQFAMGYSPSSDGMSTQGFISILGYTPTEGVSGTIISVRIQLHSQYTIARYIRLLFGHEVVASTIYEIQDVSCRQWQLDAAAPPINQDTLSSKAVISVQALDEGGAVVDTATCGEFSYLAVDLLSQLPLHSPLSSGLTSWGIPSYPPEIPTVPIQASPLCFRPNFSHLPARYPTYPDFRQASHSSFPTKEVKLRRLSKSESMTRLKYSKRVREKVIEIPILDFVTPLKDLCTSWTSTEIRAGRRLVRFSKLHDGSRLIVTGEPVNFMDYGDSDCVISCIYCDASDTYYVTSVDIIHLLEHLTGDAFPVDEKNRIRRNLEVLRPITLSKHKSRFEDFFQRVMDYPDPKPRSIEKDLKVFEWSLLDQALVKVLSKYTIDASRQIEEPETSKHSSPSSNSDSADSQLGCVMEEPSYRGNDVLDVPTRTTTLVEASDSALWFPYARRGENDTMVHRPSCSEFPQVDSDPRFSTTFNGSELPSPTWEALHSAAYPTVVGETPICRNWDSNYIVAPRSLLLNGSGHEATPHPMALAEINDPEIESHFSPYEKFTRY
ncbi:hypothetical protein Hypma_010561 [Hypsizygus marmoreus]|uniref:DUF7082 domain-containing protein n=1 Tax=Hypsizygus marmoreus TaxID=39966 RepID=A0A369JP69_HYPMA|nr:hypothetical protein Hypma_010561 [Hypsizygus marmoreus]